MPFSGWPFAIDELIPYYKPATEIVEVAPGRFDESDYWQEVTGERLPLRDGQEQLIEDGRFVLDEQVVK